MGGFFGAISKRDCVLDIFFGVDYHSHLGTRRGGMAVYDEKEGFQRQIHNIENTPFRTKFEGDLPKFCGRICFGWALAGIWKLLPKVREVQSMTAISPGWKKWVCCTPATAPAVSFTASMPPICPTAPMSMPAPAGI